MKHTGIQSEVRPTTLDLKDKILLLNVAVNLILFYNGITKRYDHPLSAESIILIGWIKRIE